MARITLNNRPVFDLEVQGVDSRDYPDFSDAFFSGGVWEDTGDLLTDEELEKLTSQYPEVVNELAHENCQSFAEYERSDE